MRVEVSMAWREEIDVVHIPVVLLLLFVEAYKYDTVVKGLGRRRKDICRDLKVILLKDDSGPPWVVS